MSRGLSPGPTLPPKHGCQYEGAESPTVMPGGNDGHPPHANQPAYPGEEQRIRQDPPAR